MKRIVFFTLAATVAFGIHAGQAATPLVVGSVRDQTGEAVAGARIVLLGAPAGTPEGRTQADGTFAVAAGGASAVRITCDFCRTEQVAVGNEPVVAIVQRYRALLQTGPGPDDANALPYAHVESALALRPFVVLADSRGVFPGPVVSDRGISRAGGLIVDNGVANYDIAANASPFFTVPAHALSGVFTAGASEAFRYGDRADAGTFGIAPTPGPPALTAGFGDDTFAVAHGQSTTAAFDAAVSANAIEHRARADARASQTFTDASVSETASFADGTLAPFPNDRISQSFGSARISGEVVRAQRRYADVAVDHGTYDVRVAALRVGSAWSDAAVRAGIETLGNARSFLEVSVRHSNGYYDAPGRLPQIAGGIDQLSVATGLRSDFERVSVHASVAAVGVDFSGGPVEDEYASPANAAGTAFVTPTFDAQLRAGGGWDFDVVAASTFRLPTLLERYARPPAAGTLAVDRNALVQFTANYTDRARLRTALTAYEQTTNGFDRGSVAGVGGSAAWQFAPRFALRSWLLHETDTTLPVTPLVRFTPAGVAATVGSAWLTYEGPGLRADAIYRRDLIDREAVGHFDFAVSANAGPDARWFATSEVRHGARFTSVGLRLNGR